MPQEDQFAPLSLDIPSTKTLEEAESDICGVTEVSGLALLFRDSLPCSHIMETTSLSQPRQESQPTDTTQCRLATALLENVISKLRPGTMGGGPKYSWCHISLLCIKDVFQDLAVHSVKLRVLTLRTWDTCLVLQNLY